VLRTDVAIVGGGFSGVMVAAHLAGHLDDGLAVSLFEPDALGRGAAYGTRHPEHLLNTRAGAMSAFEGEPDHFVRWLGSRGAADRFVSRQLYGQYLGDIARRAFERTRFTHVADRVRTIRPLASDGFVLVTDSGVEFASETVVLATGTSLPSDDFLPDTLKCHPRYVRDPWRFDYRVVEGEVLLIGSGLTALDALVALDARGHRGAVHVVSRHGRFPAVHAAQPSCYDVVPALDATSALTLVRSFRRHVADAARRKFDWRAVVEAVRPESEATWRRLPESERRRFERHIRSHWVRVRHRAPQEVDAVRSRYLDSGRLHVYSGEIAASGDAGAVVLGRNGTTHTIRPDWIVNCTGPGPSHDFGLRTQDHPGRLWLTGALLRAARFESTAVVELRVIAERVGGEIVRALGMRGIHAAL